LHQHTQFAVRQETGQHTTGVIIIKQFTSEFKIQFVTELSDALLDLFGLYLEILLVIETYFHISSEYGVQN